MTKWITETYTPMGSCFGLETTAHLHSEKTAYQQVDIYATTHFGNVMLIDNIMMLTSFENFLYHEMMSHPILFTHPHPQHVVIIGGGDCGTLQQVLLHPNVSRVQQIEIDQRVTELAEIYFPELCTSNQDERAQLLFTDGITWMQEQAEQSIDVIIVDSTDPIGPAEGLFNEAFYRDCLRALRPQGILVQQSESPLFHLELLKNIKHTMLSAGFQQAHTLLFPQPCYPAGWHSCTMASTQSPLTQFRESDAKQRPFTTRYYSDAIHHAALANPPFMG
ncbi:MAG: polyamine aminopropyltransferase [Gammaproteobacteria bacterium]